MDVWEIASPFRQRRPADQHELMPWQPPHDLEIEVPAIVVPSALAPEADDPIERRSSGKL